MPDSPSEPSLGDLFKTLASDLAQLFRQEARLVSTEMTLKAQRAGRNALLVAAGGALAFAGVLALLIAAIAALSTILPVWQAALAIGVAVLVVGAVLTLVALKGLRAIDPVPHQTIATLRDDVTWAKEQMR